VEDIEEIAPEPPRGPAGQRGDGDLADDVAEERRLGQDLDVEELRRRLERDRRQRLEPVEPGRRVDVGHRHREDHVPGPVAQPAPHAAEPRGRPAADDVVAGVDGLQERVQVGVGPGLRRRGHQHQGQRRPGQRPLQDPSPALVLRRLDDGLGHAAPAPDAIDQAPGHLLGARQFALGQHDDPDPSLRQRLAAEMGLERIVARARVGTGHGLPRRVCQTHQFLRRPSDRCGSRTLQGTAACRWWAMPAPTRASAGRPGGRRLAGCGRRGRGGRRRSGPRRCGSGAAPRWSCRPRAPRRRGAGRPG
jgi:hypothetical protein